MNGWSFELPPELEAGEPPEIRGRSRDDVRLLVSRGGHHVHARFGDLGSFLEPGDLLVLNTSATRKAALEARRSDGSPIRLHVSTGLPGGLHVVERRLADGASSRPLLGGEPETLALPDGALAAILAPYRPEGRTPVDPPAQRLWIARLELPEDLDAYLERHGQPIRYGYSRGDWPASAYQTVFATEPGSAEMPSAGRAFTPELITRLVARGVQIAPLVLHTGVSSLEAGETPYEEFARIPAQTARLVNATRKAGHRVIAVGTTVVRALESAATPDGKAHPFAGFTDLVVSPRRGRFVCDGLLTGLHEPRASHLTMLEAFLEPADLRHAYEEMLSARYLWHEFGDLHLVIGGAVRRVGGDRLRAAG